MHLNLLGDLYGQLIIPQGKKEKKGKGNDLKKKIKKFPVRKNKIESRRENVEKWIDSKARHAASSSRLSEKFRYTLKKRGAEEPAGSGIGIECALYCCPYFSLDLSRRHATTLYPDTSRQRNPTQQQPKSL